MKALNTVIAACVLTLMSVAAHATTYSLQSFSKSYTDGSTIQYNFGGAVYDFYDGGNSFDLAGLITGINVHSTLGDYSYSSCAAAQNCNFQLSGSLFWNGTNFDINHTWPVSGGEIFADYGRTLTTAQLDDYFVNGILPANVVFFGSTYVDYDGTGNATYLVNRVGPYSQSGVWVAEAVTSAVPVPAAAWLLGSGLLGLIGVSRRKAA